MIGGRSFSRQSWLLIGSTVFLLAIGLLIQFSIRANARGIPVDFRPTTQLLAITLGLLAGFIAFKVPMRIWLQSAVPVYIIAIGLLVLVKQFGVTVFGAQRWILIGGFQLQPSELVKPALVLMGAVFMPISEPKFPVRKLLQLLFILMIPVFLVVTQPDLGTAIVLISVWFAQLVVSATNPRIVGGVILVAAVIGVVSLPLLSPYQKERINTFVSGSEDASDAGYNVVQARIAIGSGGITGNGLSGGSQSQLNFLPSQHTDFVYAVVAEKLGLLGALSVLIAQVIMAISAWQISAKTTNSRLTLIAVGAATVLTVQFVINICMNVGLLPVTGIPLPFVSYGGTSIVASLFLTGWLLAIDKTANLPRIT